MKPITLKTLLSILALLILLPSCLKEEDLYSAPTNIFTGKIDTLNMGTNYSNRIYYDLETGKYTIGKQLKWDLAFGADFDNLNIKINGLNLSSIYKTDLKTVTDKIDVTKITQWKYDNPNGVVDSMAIKNWCTKSGQKYNGHSTIYLLDRGERIIDKRYYLLHFISKSEKEYEIEFIDAYGSTSIKRTIVIDKSKNYTYFSLIKNTIIGEQEPISNNKWDIEFTQYLQILHNVNPPVPYYVVGVLGNTNKVKIIHLKNVKYEDVNMVSIAGLTFPNDLDIIGYKWKTFNLSENKYLVKTKNVYIIKNRNGHFYKLRFLDYHNANGDYGYPNFQTEILK